MEEVAGLGDEAAALDRELAEKEKSLDDLLARLPNLPNPESRSPIMSKTMWS